MRTKRICLSITSVIIAASLLTGCSSAAHESDSNNADAPQTTANSDLAIESAVPAAEKDETVYVIAGADGSANKIIVSAHLKNVGGDAALTDYSTLEDIENVKGYEELLQNGDEIVWAANGNDIYYQGTGTAEAPIEMKITYTLDGKEISASELSGKSGRVKIRVDYKNNLAVTAEINGVEENICVPFAVVTGTVLDNKKFQNVEISNGKIIDDGDRTFIAALTFPALQESLGIEKEQLEIPDFIELTADVTDFEFNGFYAVAENSIFNDISLDGESTVEDLKKAAEEMNSAMAQLIDGSSQLYDGLSELNNKTTELTEGIAALSEGAAQLTAGAEVLDEGAAALNSGIVQINAGSKELSDGLSELDKNSTALNNGAKQIFASLLSQTHSQLANKGIELPELTAENYADMLDGAAAQAEMAMGKEAAAEITAVKAQLDEVKSFCDGLNAYTSGVSSASAGAQAVADATTQLLQGSDELKDGASSLRDGTISIADGMDTLSAGGGKMAEGISQLTEGAAALNNGIITFNNEAVQTLVEMADGDLTNIMVRLNEISNASESYRNYSGITDETSGNVKLIFRTEEIKAE